MPDCPICISRLDGADISALPCGHVFHGACVLQALEHRKHCPSCRHPCKTTNVIKLFINDGLGGSAGSPSQPARSQAAAAPATLSPPEIAALQNRVREYEGTVTSLREALKQGQESRAKAESEVKTAKQEVEKAKKARALALEEVEHWKTNHGHVESKCEKLQKELADKEVALQAAEFVKQTCRGDGKEAGAVSARDLARKMRNPADVVAVLESSVQCQRREIQRIRADFELERVKSEETTARLRRDCASYSEKLEKQYLIEERLMKRVEELQRENAALKEKPAPPAAEPRRTVAGPRGPAPPPAPAPAPTKAPPPPQPVAPKLAAGSRGGVVDLDEDEDEGGYSEGEGDFLRRGGPRPTSAPARDAPEPPRRPLSALERWPAPAVPRQQFEHAGVYGTGYSGTGERVRAYSFGRGPDDMEDGRGAKRAALSGAAPSLKRKKLGPTGHLQPIGNFLIKKG